MEAKLQEMILQEHSKAQMLRIVHWVGSDKYRFKALVQNFLSENPILHQRAGYPLSNIVIQNPDSILPYLDKILLMAAKPGLHKAIRRNTARMLEHLQLPSKYKGKVLNLCFDWIADPNEKVAIKAFSLTVLEHMLDEYPDIGSELRLIIEDQWHRQTPAFQYRAKRVLLKLKASTR